MSNSSARHLLESIYGKGCMFQKAYIAQRIEELGGIKTYKIYLKETRYKRRKIHLLENRMTYHHLEHEADGGKTDVLNGAIVGELPHRYIHSLPREQEEIINDMLREYKYNIDIGMSIITPTEDTLEMTKSGIITISMDTKDELFSIPLYDNSKEENERAYNRAKQKEELRKIILEELNNDDNERE